MSLDRKTVRNDAMDLLTSLLTVSERAANIARCCRSNEHLVELLVQEKSDHDKNPRFVQDFKTLADVLIQETVRHVVGNKFPELKNQIYGEECPVFTNTLGESVHVSIQENEAATADMLLKVLDNDKQAAEVLAHKVHQDVSIQDINVERLPEESLNDLQWDIKNFGVWIDPIDSTAEYITGEAGVENDEGICTGGLPCVTVLIGLFNHDSGAPVFGVVNQPFHKKLAQVWVGHAYWGIKWDQISTSSVKPTQQRENEIVMLSSSEKPELRSKLMEAGYNVCNPPGAGYKLLCVARGLADLYILSKGTTFQWDTCAPHALMSSLQGGVVSYKFARTGEIRQLVYHHDEFGKACNKEGIVAYRNIESFKKLVQLLQEF